MWSSNINTKTAVLGGFFLLLFLLFLLFFCFCVCFCLVEDERMVSILMVCL